MSNIVLHSGAQSEDIFFGLTPQVTDWNAFLSAVPTTGLDGLLAECHNLEPLQETDPNDYKMWVLFSRRFVRCSGTRMVCRL